MPDTVERALNVAMMAATVDKEEYTSFQEAKGQGKRVFAVEGNRADVPLEQDKGTLRKFQWSRGSRRGFADRDAGHNSRRGGGDGVPSRQFEGRSSVGRRNQWPPIGEAMASEPKSGDDRCAPQSKDIRCYGCGQLGHTEGVSTRAT